MERFISIVFSSCLYIVLVVGHRVEKCGLVDFDPQAVHLQTLLLNNYYAYSSLPVPPCTNITLRYINFCYNFVSPSSQSRTETVGQLYILEERSEFEHYIRAYRELQTDTSSCEGTLFSNGGFQLCCISTLLNFNAFKITQGSVSYTFALHVPANSDHSISLGYNDTHNYRVLGFQPDFITRTIDSIVGRMGQLIPLPLPLISFTEMATTSFLNEVFPSIPPRTEEMSTTLPVTTSSTKVTTKLLATPTTTDTTSTVAASGSLSTANHSNTISDEPGRVNPGIQGFVDNSIYKSAIYILAALSSTLTIIITILLIVIALLIRKNYKLASKSDIIKHKPSLPPTHNVCAERAQGDGEDANFTDSTSENYDLLTHKTPREMTDPEVSLEGYDQLYSNTSSGIAMGGNAAYMEAHEMTKLRMQRNAAEGFQDESESRRRFEETTGFSTSVYYNYLGRRGQEGSNENMVMMSCDSSYYILPSLLKYYTKKHLPQRNLREQNRRASNNCNIPTCVAAQQQPHDVDLNEYIQMIPLSSNGHLNMTQLRSTSVDNIPALYVTKPVTLPAQTPPYAFRPGGPSASCEVLSIGIQQQSTASLGSGNRGKTLEVNKSSSMKSNHLYNMTMTPTNQV